MQQRVFIVEPFAEENGSKLSLDFFDYPLERSSISSDCISIEKQLHDLSEISVRASQYSGLFLFGIDRKLHKFTFSWFSSPTLIAILRLIIVTVMTVYYVLAKDAIEEQLAAKIKQEATLGMTEIILSATIISSDAIGMTLFLLDRKRIENFLNRFLQSIILIAEDLKNPDWVNEWFRQASKRARWLVNGINLSANISIFLVLYRDGFRFILFLLGREQLDWFELTFPIFSFFWFTILFRRLHFRVFLMSMIDTLQFGFMTVKEHVRDLANDKSTTVGDVRISNAFGRIESSKNGKNNTNSSDITVTDYVRQVKLTKILEMYRSMEQLVGEFNDLFARHLLIGISSVLTVMLIALFHLFVNVNGQMDGDVLTFSLEAGLHIWVLYSLGTSATEMANEADACIIALRDVPLGTIDLQLKRRVMMHFQQAVAVPLVVSPGQFFSLNRKMITSVAGTLTTYLIVLIQFQSTEKHAISVQNHTTPLLTTTDEM